MVSTLVELLAAVESHSPDTVFAEVAMPLIPFSSFIYC